MSTQALRVFFARHGNSAELEEATRDFFEEHADTAAPPASPPGDRGRRPSTPSGDGGRRPSVGYRRASVGPASPGADGDLPSVSFGQFYSRFGSFLPQPRRLSRLGGRT